MFCTQGYLPESVYLFHVVKAFPSFLPSHPELSMCALILFHLISFLC